MIRIFGYRLKASTCLYALLLGNTYFWGNTDAYTICWRQAIATLTRYIDKSSHEDLVNYVWRYTKRCGVGDDAGYLRLKKKLEGPSGISTLRTELARLTKEAACRSNYSGLRISRNRWYTSRSHPWIVGVWPRCLSTVQISFKFETGLFQNWTGE